MSIRRSLAIVAVVLGASACADQDPTAVNTSSFETAQLNHTPTHTGLLSNIPIVGTLPGGGTFTGVLNVTNLVFQNGQLLASGTLVGTATQAGGTIVTAINQTFTNVLVGLLGTAGSCKILVLDIPGGLTLDVLGLVVDLAPVNLEIRAERGPGNLLGNLLCALVGLLDQGGPLAGILNLLNQINNLL